jgi:hypothetical protein
MFQKKVPLDLVVVKQVLALIIHDMRLHLQRVIHSQVYIILYNTIALSLYVLLDKSLLDSHWMILVGLALDILELVLLITMELTVLEHLILIVLSLGLVEIVHVELSYERGIVVVLEVFWKHFFRKLGLVFNYEGVAFWRP